MVKPRQIVWQPVIDLTNDSVMGHEALARFGGDRTPVDAFAEAIRIGRATALDRACIHMALASAPPSGYLFVNLHAETIAGGIWPRVPPALRARVVWELPEDAGWNPDSVPPDAVVALDDVGVGFAELVRISRVAWRFLKLDRSLVHDIARSPQRHPLIADLVNRAEERGARVIAEGVETVQDLQTLRFLGVPYGQGFLWGQPHAYTDTVQSERA